MTYTVLPLTEDPWQVFTLDLAIDGEEFHAQVDLRYLPAPDQWFLTLRDHSSGELLANSLPLICSRTELNDLLSPFRHLREGKGLGSLFVLRAMDETTTPDPAAGNLTEFQVLLGDTFDD